MWNYQKAAAPFRFMASDDFRLAFEKLRKLHGSDYGIAWGAVWLTQGWVGGLLCPDGRVIAYDTDGRFYEVSEEPEAFS